MKKIFRVGLVIIILFLAYKLLNQQSVGKINYQPKGSEKPVETEYIRYDGSGLSFSYENKYGLQGQEGNWLLVGKAGIANQIVIMMGPARSGEIEEVSGVQMRRIKNKEYIEEKINWKETEGVMFKKIEGFERTAFFLKNGKAISVAMTANSNDNQANEAEFLKLIESMELK